MSVPFIAEMSATREWKFHYKVNAAYGDKTFNAEGDCTWHGKTREEARQTLSFAICKRFWPGVGQLRPSELQLT